MYAQQSMIRMRLVRGFYNLRAIGTGIKVDQLTPTQGQIKLNLEIGVAAGNQQAHKRHHRIKSGDSICNVSFKGAASKGGFFIVPWGLYQNMNMI